MMPSTARLLSSGARDSHVHVIDEVRNQESFAPHRRSTGAVEYEDLGYDWYQVRPGSTARHVCRQSSTSGRNNSNIFGIRAGDFNI